MSNVSEVAELSKFLNCPIQGILHAGGILNDALLSRQNPGLVREVYGPKYYGAKNLLQVASSSNLFGFFFLFAIK